jgi:hypothetical protein
MYSEWQNSLASSNTERETPDHHHVGTNAAQHLSEDHGLKWVEVARFF